MQITFEQVPQALAQLIEMVNKIVDQLENLPRQESIPGLEKWFTIDELIDYLPGKPSKATIYGYVHKREIPHKKMGKRLAFRKSEIDNWLIAKGRKTKCEIEAEANIFINSQKSKK